MFKFSEAERRMLIQLSEYAENMGRALRDTDKFLEGEHCVADISFDSAILLCDKISVSLDMLYKRIIKK